MTWTRSELRHLDRIALIEIVREINKRFPTSAIITQGKTKEEIIEEILKKEPKA